MTKSLLIKILSVLVILGLLVGTSLLSFPRLSTEYATACKTCHVNPNGGGMRTEFGNYSVALNELCLPSTKRLVIEKYKNPRLSDGVNIGFDSRYLVFDDFRVFRMQTDAFISIEPFKDFFYHFRFWEFGVAEHFGMLYLDQQKYYIKLGRFYPAFGLRNADHKAFNRERTGHGSNVYLDGISLGAEVDGFNFAAEAFNPGEQGVYGLHVFRTSFVEPIGLLYGASFRSSERRNGSFGAFPHAKSVFYGINYDRFTLTGEFDMVGKANTSFIAYQGLTTRLEYGFYLIAEYNYFNADRHAPDDVDAFLRFSIELYPIPFCQIRPSYTRYTSGLLDGEDDFFLQLHIGY